MTGPAESDSAAEFWPWGRRAAVATTAVALLLLVGGVATLRITAGWPDPRWEGAVLLAAVLVSLLPVGLLVLQSVAAARGSVSFRGVSLDFGAAAQAAANAASRSTVTVPRNVTDSGVDIGDSGHSEVLSVLQDASRADVVVVDLEDGHAWWDSRLLLLCAGAQRAGRPRAVVFVATLDGVRRRFVGWSQPAEVAAQLVKAEPELQFACAVADTSTRRAELTFPARADPPGSYPQLTAALVDPLPPGAAVADHELFERRGDLLVPAAPAAAFTRALARALHPLEESGRVGHVSVIRLLELLAPVLHVSSLEHTAPDADWARAAVQLDADYLVVTDGGVYRGLAARDDLTRALLGAVLASVTGTDGEAPVPAAPSPGSGAAIRAGALAPAPIAPLVPEARTAARQPAREG